MGGGDSTKAEDKVSVLEGLMTELTNSHTQEKLVEVQSPGKAGQVELRVDRCCGHSRGWGDLS